MNPNPQNPPRHGATSRLKCILCGGKAIGKGVFVPHGGGRSQAYLTCARHAPNKPGNVRLIEIALGVPGPHP